MKHRHGLLKKGFLLGLVLFFIFTPLSVLAQTNSANAITKEDFANLLVEVAELAGVDARAISGDSSPLTREVAAQMI